MEQIIRRLLGGGRFSVSITGNGFTLMDQKVISFEDGIVYSVDRAGIVRATNIAQIVSVDF